MNRCFILTSKKPLDRFFEVLIQNGISFDLDLNGKFLTSLTKSLAVLD